MSTKQFTFCFYEEDVKYHVYADNFVDAEILVKAQRIQEGKKHSAYEVVSNKGNLSMKVNEK